MWNLYMLTNLATPLNEVSDYTSSCVGISVCPPPALSERCLSGNHVVILPDSVLLRVQLTKTA